MHRFLRKPWLAVSLAVFVAGCSDNSGGRVGVVGHVKLKGQPIKSGIISFEPTGGQDTAVTSPINNGAYEIPRASGLKPGKYLIRVTAGDGKTPVNPVNPDEPPGPGGKGTTNIVSKDLVPADWNVRSKQEREVTDKNPNTFDFDIP